MLAVSATIRSRTPAAVGPEDEPAGDRMATTTLPERGDLRVLGHRGRAEGEARRGRPGRSHRDRPDRSGSPDRPAYTNTGSSFLDPWDRRLARHGRATSFGRSYW